VASHGAYEPLGKDRARVLSPASPIVLTEKFGHMILDFRILYSPQIFFSSGRWGAPAGATRAEIRSSLAFPLTREREFNKLFSHVEINQERK
jgi:hypothetical protein